MKKWLDDGLGSFTFVMSKYAAERDWQALETSDSGGDEG